MTVLGKLRKGAEKQGNRPGADLDYFRFDTSDRALSQMFEGLYGDRPGDGYENGIRFFFPSAEFEQCMPTMKAAYKGGTCYVLCDGENIHGERVAVKTKEGSRWVSHAAHRFPACRFPACLGNESCNAVGKLRIVIPEFKRFGVVEVVVGALNDLEHVSKQIAEIEDKVSQHGADLSMVPLIIYRQKREISTPKSVDKNGVRSEDRARRAKSLIEVSIAPEFFSKAIAARNSFALDSASRLSIAGSRTESLAIAPAMPETATWQDEFGDRVDTNFKATELWANIKMAFDKCRDIPTVQKYHAAGNSRVVSGELPEAARRSLAVLAQNAKQRILETQDFTPMVIEAEVVEDVAPTVKERMEAIALRTGRTMAEIEAIAGKAKLQTEDITQWTEAQCQTVRDIAYAYCGAAIKKFGDVDKAGAEYDLFQDKSKVNSYDDENVWSAWSAIAA